MLAACAVGMATFLNPGLLDSIDPGTLQLGSLAAVALTSSVMGLHLTASIGGGEWKMIV
jgi:hypothetical protein